MGEMADSANNLYNWHINCFTSRFLSGKNVIFRLHLSDIFSFTRIRMKTSTLFKVGLLALSMVYALFLPGVQAQQLSADQVPGAVRKAFPASSGITPNWRKNGKGYEAAFASAGKHYVYVYSGDGLLQQKKTVLNADQLPGAVKTRIKEKKFDLANISEAYSVATRQKSKYLEVFVTQTDKIHRLRYSQQGALISEASRPNTNAEVVVEKTPVKDPVTTESTNTVVKTDADADTGVVVKVPDEKTEETPVVTMRGESSTTVSTNTTNTTVETTISEDDYEFDDDLDSDLDDEFGDLLDDDMEVDDSDLWEDDEEDDDWDEWGDGSFDF